ncbi:MAG: hypothetical protein JWR68_1269 [Polaromonas sp.]|nr:hypothetical protein [Polaromonas sp.]
MRNLSIPEVLCLIRYQCEFQHEPKAMALRTVQFWTLAQQAQVGCIG